MAGVAGSLGWDRSWGWGCEVAPSYGDSGGGWAVGRLDRLWEAVGLQRGKTVQALPLRCEVRDADPGRGLGSLAFPALEDPSVSQTGNSPARLQGSIPDPSPISWGRKEGWRLG